MKARYLTFFSYIGTSFRSSEKIWLKEGRNYPDPDSVQGRMEIALLRLRSLNYPNVVLSSRTDGGVHALNSSAHFDLDRFGTQIYEPDYITYNLNRFFYKTNSNIIIKKCLRVSDDFHARFKAVSRTYLYRLAVLKEGIEITEKDSIGSYIPIEELNRCHFNKLQGFNIERFKEGAKYLEGYHDFSTFKRFDKLNPHKHNRRELKSITITPGKPIVTTYNQENSYFDYWDIEFKGRAFVHNQIRRMVGTLLSVSVGKLQPEDIKLMLQVPSKHSWHTFIQAGPPDGLYLCNVNYNPEDLIYNPEKTKDQDSGIDSESDGE